MNEAHEQGRLPTDRSHAAMLLEIVESIALPLKDELGAMCLPICRSPDAGGFNVET